VSLRRLDPNRFLGKYIARKLTIENPNSSLKNWQVMLMLGWDFGLNIRMQQTVEVLS
jgi:hypothetical protein